MAAACFAFGPIEARASGVDQLQSQLNSLQRQINMLKSQQQELTSQQEQLNEQAHQQRVISMQQVRFMQDELRVKKKASWYLTGDEAVPAFKTNDGESTFTIGGQIALDSSVGTVPRPGSTTGGLNRGGFSGGVDFRRIELEVAGVYAKHYIFKVEEDFSKTTSPLGGILDVYLGYTGKTGPVTHTFLVGNQHTPFGFQVPSDATIFLENEMGNTIFQPGRQTGITGREADKQFNAWYGFTGSGTAKPVTQLDYTGNNQYTAAGVFAWNFINTPGHLLSVRGSVAYNRFNATSDNGLITANEATFTTPPDAAVYGTSFISTGALNVQSDLVESPRVDFEWNRFSFGAVYYAAQTQSNSITSAVAPINRRKLQPKFSSWDVEAQYFLTPDHEPYSSAQGYYVNVRPTHPVTDGGIGAIGLAARVDEANLNSQRYQVHGGNETNLTLGVNWWPTDNTRVNLNYVKVFPVTGGGAGYTNTPTPGTSIYRKKNASIVALRLEFIY